MRRVARSPAHSPRGGAGDAPTVIIVGAEPRKIVTVARSLHRAGVRCIVATPHGQPLRVSSRAFAGVVRLRGDLADSADMLARLARSEGAAWVVPTSDSSLQIVCAAYQDLSRHSAVGSPPPAIVQRVLDKAITLAIAKRCGVPVPTSVTIARATRARIGTRDNALSDRREARRQEPQVRARLQDAHVQRARTSCAPYSRRRRGSARDCSSSPITADRAWASSCCCQGAKSSRAFSIGGSRKIRRRAALRWLRCRRR